MRRRAFLAAGAAAPSMALLGGAAPAPADAHAARIGEVLTALPAGVPQGGAPIARFAVAAGPARGDWQVHERLDAAGGTLWFVSPTGRVLVLPLRLEACGAGPGPFYCGLTLAEVAGSGPDLLADRLLAHGGDPDPEAVRRAAPPPGSRIVPGDLGARLLWTFFLATREGTDTMPVTPAGSTRNWHVQQALPMLANDSAMVADRREGLLGGWMPALVKRFDAGAGVEHEVMLFAPVGTDDPPLTPTLQRVRRIEQGRVTDTRFFGSYPAFGPVQTAPDAAGFYAALLGFALSWQAELSEGASLSLPVPDWADMNRHAFARELMTRGGGVYPHYGAVDRDYVGSEYDGFQDSFTSSLLANLEWGRFAQARAVLENFLSGFVQDDGLARMRGTEVGQTGLGLSLIARYALLTGDLATPRRWQGRIAAMAGLLAMLHDRSLSLPAEDAGHGLIAGWSESDSCLFPDPSVWWQPYFGNSALAARGFGDLAAVWTRIDPAGAGAAADWTRRASLLTRQLDASLRRDIRHDLSPPYVPILPGVQETFRESLARPGVSEQQWPHRVYAELLQAGVLAPDLEAMVIDSMRGHGATSIGVVANIGPPQADGRDLLGFISYGYAHALLRQERIEDYLLFLYAHRFHAHTPGSWTAAEVADISGGLPLFCIPAQLTIPILLRWMLVDEDADTLHLARAVPRAWIMSGHPVGIEAAPTRWGPVGFSLVAEGRDALHGMISLPPGFDGRLRLVLRHDEALRPARLDVTGAQARQDPAAGHSVVWLDAPHAARITLRLALSA